MQHVSIHLLKEDAPSVAVALTKSAVFHCEIVDIPDDALPDSPGDRYRTIYTSAHARLEKIVSRLGPATRPMVRDARVVELDELERVNDQLGLLWREVSALEEQQRSLVEQRRSIGSLRESLDKFARLDVNLGLLNRHGHFLDLRLGTIPRANRDRLEAAAALAGHFAGSFHTTEQLDYVVVAGPCESQHEIAGLLEAADFRAIEIPTEFKDHPDKIHRRLIEQATRLEDDIARNRSDLDTMSKGHREQIIAAAETLHLAAPYSLMASNLRGRGGLVLVHGWVPKRNVADLEHALDFELEHPFALSVRDPKPAERSHVPSCMRHARLLRPFSDLVRNYGVPRYREFDPTVVFSISFIAMFGMMFGDVGQGIVITLAGLAMVKRFPRIVTFMVGAGIASTAFGFVYGSVFGYEHLIQPLWISPLSDPTAMLEVALLWGILFIVSVNLLTIYNLINDGRRWEAVFGPKGLAGLILYLGGICVVYEWLEHGEPAFWIMLPALIGMTALIGYKWRTTAGALGERILVVLIEAFESVTSYLANTLSFLRVAAFSLNHVALAIAVFTLAEALGNVGHGLTVVIGNIFIIALEGAIVSIQALRLEYYEGFSRFYRGDGLEFRPLRLGADASI